MSQLKVSFTDLTPLEGGGTGKGIDQTDFIHLEAQKAVRSGSSVAERRITLSSGREAART